MFSRFFFVSSLYTDFKGKSRALFYFEMTQCVLDSYRIREKWNILSYKIQKKEKKTTEKRKKNAVLTF